MLVARRPAASGYAGLISILVKCGYILLSILSLIVGVSLEKIISADETIVGLWDQNAVFYVRSYLRELPNKCFIYGALHIFHFSYLLGGLPSKTSGMS